MGTEIPDGLTMSSAPSQAARELCHGTYSAQQVPGAVIVKAEGWHPTSGYRTYLEKSPIAVYPPQFILLHEAPAGATLQVLTPFTVRAMFQAEEPVATVVVHHAEGKTEVPVEQVRDVATQSNKRCCGGHGWVMV